MSWWLSSELWGGKGCVHGIQNLNKFVIVILFCLLSEFGIVADDQMLVGVFGGHRLPVEIEPWTAWVRAIRVSVFSKICE